MSFKIHGPQKGLSEQLMKSTLDEEDFFEVWPYRPIRFGLMLIHQQCECTECRANTKLRNRMKPHYDNVRASEGADFKDTQLIMYKPQVPGFLLTQKTWARLAVNQIKTTSGGVSTVALDHLCLTDDDNSNNTKHLIQNLVHNHGKKETEKPPDVPDLP